MFSKGDKMLQRRYEGDYPTVQGALPRDAQFEAPKTVLTRDIMSKNVITVDPDMDVMKVVDLLTRKKITGAPVVDKSGKLIGVVSEKDTFKLILNGGFNQSIHSSVQDVMSKEVASVAPDDDVFKIANLFYRSNYRRLPVVEDGRVVGVVSRRDILECIRDMGH